MSLLRKCLKLLILVAIGSWIGGVAGGIGGGIASWVSGGAVDWAAVRMYARIGAFGVALASGLHAAVILWE